MPQMPQGKSQQHGIEGSLDNRVFHCYIDESGDEGYQLASGSSPWFFLAAVIMQDEQEPAVRHAIDEIEDKLWRSKGQIPPKVLHWKDLRYEQKVVVCQVLRQKPYLQVTVGIRKGEIRDGALIKQSGFLYRYATRFLLERVTWYIASTNGWARMVFSNRARFRQELLCAYLSQVLADQKSTMKPIFDPAEIRVAFPSQVKALQVADACVSAVAAAFNPDYYGNTHDEYFGLISNRFYRYGNRLLSYGLKLFPEKGLLQEYPFLTKWK